MLQNHLGQSASLRIDLSEREKNQILAANHELFMQAGQIKEL
jgi:hypothetical protein